MLHLANTFFEAELAGTLKESCSLQQAMHASSRYLQLQFLPVLYAKADEGICVTSLPDEEYRQNVKKFTAQKKLHWLPLETPCRGSELSVWGASRIVQHWAQAKGLLYTCPDFEKIKFLNSKATSFSLCHPLPHSELLYDQKDLKRWLSHGEKGVLKSCFGVAGRGHCFSPNLSFAKKEWEAGRPILAEPWVERVRDFSTQWICDRGKLRYYGATLLENTPRGSYKGTTVGDEKELFGTYYDFLQQQKEEVSKRIISDYTGYLGVDAMVYRLSNRLHLHPLVEINARRTMGKALLDLWKETYPEKKGLGLGTHPTFFPIFPNPMKQLYLSFF